MNPIVSIVTPSYNQGQFIEETIRSVLNQTYKNIQYIVVDGGSTDDTMDVVNKYRDRIDIVIHEKDNGQSDAINKGFKLATGELVGWINSDDLLYPDCVEKIVDVYSKNPEGAIFYGSNLDVIDEKGSWIKLWPQKIPGKKYLLNQSYDVIQPASFYSNQYVKQCNYLNEKLHYCMDLDLWLKLLNYGNIYSYDVKPLAAIRNWNDTKTATGGYKFLREIRSTLLHHGAHIFSRTIWRLNWYELKCYIKNSVPGRCFRLNNRSFYNVL